MTDTEQRVAIITGGSQGIDAGLTAGEILHIDGGQVAGH